MFLGVIKLIGVAAFLYLTWRNLYDDYQDDKLISYTWLTLLVMVVTGRITYGIANWGVWNDSVWNWFSLVAKPGFTLSGAIVGLWLFSGWYAFNNNWKLWPFLEDVTPSVYLLLAFMAGEAYVKSGYEMKNLYLMLIPLFSYLLSNMIARKYRSLVWYKSGKKGFVFFFINFIAGIMLAAVNVLYNGSWLLTGVYVGLSLISITGLFILGEVFNNLTKSFWRK